MLKPPLPFRLRPMRLADVSAVMAIERQAFPVPWSASAYEYEVTKNRRANYQVLTVSQADFPTQLIGYAGYWLMAGELHVSTIATDPNWRGRGLGELLLLNILAMGCDEPAHMATLEVRVGNKVAQALYRKYQFEVVGRRRRYYQGTEDALLMTVESLDHAYRAMLRGQRLALFKRLRMYQAPVPAG